MTEDSSRDGSTAASTQVTCETVRQHKRHQIAAAWALHTLTASGVIVGMLGMHAVIDGHARGAILWLNLALVLDGIDGPLARKLEVKERIPTLDGNALDLIIDYFTCTIVPVAFLDKFHVLPRHTVTLTGFAVLLVGALWMARTDQETPERWFRGFPAEWNLIIPTLFLINANEWLSLGICIVLCVLTLSRVEFPHPLSVREQRPVSLVFIVLWLGSMSWLAIAQHDVPAVKLVLIVSPFWTVWQVIRRRWMQRNPPVGIAVP